MLFVKYHLMLGRHICLTLSLLAYLVFLVPILCKVLIVHRLNYPGCRILFMRGFRFWSSFYGDLRFTASADSWQGTFEQLGPDFMHLLCLSRACI